MRSYKFRLYPTYQQQNRLQNTLEACRGIFYNMLDYKCAMLVGVPAKNTSVDCSRCGKSIPKNVAIRIHRCDSCGLVLDRDYNVSINILKKGLEMVGRGNYYNFPVLELPQELREVTLVEMQNASLKQEQTTEFQ